MVQSQEKNIHKPRTRTSDNLAMSQTSSSNPYSLKWKLGPHGTELGSPGRASGVRKTYKKYCFGSEQACLLLAYNFCWLGLEYIEIFFKILLCVSDHWDTAVYSFNVPVFCHECCVLRNTQHMRNTSIPRNISPNWILSGNLNIFQANFIWKKFEIVTLSDEEHLEISALINNKTAQLFGKW